VSATTSFAALGTTATVVVTDEVELLRARTILARSLDELDRAASRFRLDSDLSNANASAGTAVAVSPTLIAAVQAALDAARSTDGLVDPTLGADLRAAGYDRTFAFVRVRDRWAVEERQRRRRGWEAVEVDPERGTLRVPRGCELDLGATAKAQWADRSADSIAMECGCGVLVSLGGDIAVAGEPPAGGWCIRVADDHSAPLEVAGPRILLGSGGVATSSTAVRNWPTDRGRAHHLLDPRTGRPATTPWRTVSVAARSCLDANVASTAAIVLGASAPTWLREGGLPARLVASDGALVHVAGWPAEAEAA
jgi:thiamine biosynthesis lipoprotein